MKRIAKMCSAIVMMTALTGMTSPLRAQSYEKLWTDVEQAEKKSLPQTVIELTGKICQKAQAEKNAAQLFKAYLCRANAKEHLTPDSVYSRLAYMEQWEQNEDNVTNKAILNSILAEEYADYVLENRHTLQKHTELHLTTDNAPADIREWSLNLFRDKIDRLCQASLQAPKALLTTQTDKYVPFVEQKEGSAYYKHDLYHLLAKRAANIYLIQFSSVNADSLRDVRLETIYHNMMDTYRQAGSEDALLLCTLEYWEMRKLWKSNLRPYRTGNESAGQQDDTYMHMLDSLITRYGTRELCAEAYYAKAQYLNGKQRYNEALQVCDEGIKRYAGYKRINILKDLRSSIMNPALSVSFPEMVYPGDSIKIQLGHKNLKEATLRLYATDFDEMPYPYNDIDQSIYKHTRLLNTINIALKPQPQEGANESDLPYFNSKQEVTAVAPNRPGVYILRVSTKDKKAEDANYLIVSRFKALLFNIGNDKLEVHTLDSRTGQPIANAQVTFYSSYRNEHEAKKVISITTDAEGRKVLDWNKSIRCYDIKSDDDKAMRKQDIYLQDYNTHPSSRTDEMLTLLTDRSIYRPGQTVHIKGIAYNRETDHSEVVQDVDFELALYDANGSQLATRQVKTNDYGSFQADFTLPSVCLNGRFHIKASGGKHNQATYFQVEEYKRPTFEIDIEPVQTAYKLGDTVTVKGQVKAFNGMSVQHVPLTYTITRNLILGRTYDKPIKSDTISLDAEGRFVIPLKLEGESNANWDYCSFEVNASVTNEAGETQTSSYQLSANNNAYLFNCNVPQMVCKADTLTHTFYIKNANGIIQNLSGTYKLYRLKDGESDIKENELLSRRPDYENHFLSNQPTDCQEWKTLPSGLYRIVISVEDSLGRKENNFNSSRECLIFSADEQRPPVKTDIFFYAKDTEFDANTPATFLFGTSHHNAYVLMNLYRSDKRMESRIIQLDNAITRITLPYKEEYGNDICVQLCFVKNGESISERVFLKKRQPARTLDLKWEVFRDRLEPGQDEEWRLIVKTPDGLPAAAEMLATMYDASLDKLMPNHQVLNVAYPSTWHNPRIYESRGGVNYFTLSYPSRDFRYSPIEYDSFWQPNRYVFTQSIILSSVNTRTQAKAPQASEEFWIRGIATDEADSLEEKIVVGNGAQLPPASDGLRTNFAETAFFYPQLRTNEKGEIVITFTIPQSLTEWNFRGYAHTKDMQTGMLQATAVTSKDFMLTPNMPRFVRTNDETHIAATVANRTGQKLKGTAILTLFDPETEKVILTRKDKFEVEAGRTGAVAFGFDVPQDYNLLGVRIKAESHSFSDGEQHILPVLSDKEYITETLPMPIRGKQTRTFSLDSLFNRHNPSATERKLTIEFTANPAWYAVLALPSLTQPLSDNAIDWATAYYTNTLASYIADSQPRIRLMVENWRTGNPAQKTLLSRLQANEELKSILLDESPWILDATQESDRMASLTTLFDNNQLSNRNASARAKLKELQESDGSWTWFKGMNGNAYVTRYITSLLVRLPQLTGKPLDKEVTDLRTKAFGFLHKQTIKEYENMRRMEANGSQIKYLSATALDYLYLVALSGEEVPSQAREAYRYFMRYIDNELDNGTDMSRKAHAAIILMKSGDKKKANDFIASLAQHLITEDEQGAHFAFNDLPGNRNQNALNAHVATMEALLMAGGQEQLLEEMKIWLLKQKQSTSWTSPIASADAIYALLSGTNNNLLDGNGDARISIGHTTIETAKASEVPGLGYIKESYTQNDPESKAKAITVEKRDEGIAWGAVYAQYLSPLTDVTQDGNSLDIKRVFYVERIAANGTKTLEPLKKGDKLKVGDIIVSRLTIRTDRAMDFVQLKEQRAACLEPTSARSGYRWNAGTGYYADIKDASTTFFFDHLGKGTYVLEHRCLVARTGYYQSGLATLQSAYAPEYSSHTDNVTLEVEE